MKKKQQVIKVAVVGAGKKCGPFLETLSSIPGIEVVALIDFHSDPTSLAAAKEAGAPMTNTAMDLERYQPDLILLTTDKSEITTMLEEQAPEGVPIINGAATRLLRIVSAYYRKNSRYVDKYYAAQREVDKLAERDGMIIGKSAPIVEAMDLIEQVAPMPTSVLLLGETGCGKDLFARCIHRSSALRHKPLISVNCTALTPSLMESELFGYKKGAFTGAERDHAGMLEEADGGTLFLDEIGDMQLELQAKLLRFLQTGEIRRVGSSRVRHVKVRIIAATNCDLETAVGKGDFRSDLFYRLNTFTITLPPLRERSMDVPYLAYHFITKAEAKLNKKINGVSDDALSMLSGYAWPGNVRELENIIERAVILCRNGQITPGELPAQMHRAAPETPGMAHTTGQAKESAAAHPAPEADFHLSKARVMENFEKKELQNYIKKAEGNISEASRISGIPRRTFYRKMKKYGL